MFADIFEVERRPSCIGANGKYRDVASGVGGDEQELAGFIETTSSRVSPKSGI